MVSELLKLGKNNAVTHEYLTAVLGLRSRRELWKQIQIERTAGALILPDNAGGYYLGEMETAAGRAEVAAWRRRLGSMARSTEAVTRAAGRVEPPNTSVDSLAR